MRGVDVKKKIPRTSLVGQTCIITGSNSGIGLACTQILPTLGVSHLILAVRSVHKGEMAALPLRLAYPRMIIDVWDLDMSSYASIVSFAHRCYTLSRIDVAILNAGVRSGCVSKMNDSTGHEETIQVNYLSTALLSILLLPIWAMNQGKDQPGRLTIVGCNDALFASLPNHTAKPVLLMLDKPFSGLLAARERYVASKVLVMMLVHKLSQLVSSDCVVINAVALGLTSGTQLYRHFSGGEALIMDLTKKVVARTPEQAACTYKDAVTVHGKESHGAVIKSRKVHPFPSFLNTDEGKKCAETLWEETMAELKFAGVKQILDSIGGTS